MKHVLLKRFFSNQSGSVLLLVGLSFLFLVGIAGAGYDLGRQQLVRQKIQQAADTAALAAASKKCEEGVTECKQRHDTALLYFNLNYPRDYMGVKRPPPIIKTLAGKPVEVDADTSLRNSFVSNLIHPTTNQPMEQSDVHAHSAVGAGSPANLDVLMLLDVSGSMRDGADGGYASSSNPAKIDGLINAASTFIHSLLDINPATCNAGNLAGCNRVGFLPYSLGAPPFTVTQDSACNCMHYLQYNCCGTGCGSGPPGSGEGDASDIFGKKFFAGLGRCLISDAAAQASCEPTGCGSYQVDLNSIPNCSRYDRPRCTFYSERGPNCNLPPPDCIPYKAPNGAGQIYGCFPDELGDSTHYCEKLVIASGSDCNWHINYSDNYPSGYDPNPTLVGKRLDSLRVFGKTNSADAFAKAMDPAGIPVEALAPGSTTPLVLLPSARTSTYGVAKIVVWMTDGNNTAWTDNSKPTIECTYRNGRLNCGGGNSRINFTSDDDNGYGAQSDKDTRAACNTLKSSPQNTVIYTIGFGKDASVPGSRAYQLLNECASGSPSTNLNHYFFIAPDNATLSTVFQTILDNINKIRITE